MTKLKNKFLAVLCFALAACTTPETPAQAVYQTQAAFAVALKTEIAYSKLPDCSKTISPACSKKEVIKATQEAGNKAWAAIKEAQTAVRTPGFGENNVVTAIAAARALTNAYTEITEDLEVK